MKTFSAEDLVKIALKGVELGLLEIGREKWHLNVEDIDGADSFDCACGRNITLETMKAWDSLRAWVEKEFDVEMSLYIGSRGEYEDAYNVYVIEPTENIKEREEARKRKRLEYKRRRVEQRGFFQPETVLGDLDALAQLKAKLDGRL